MPSKGSVSAIAEASSQALNVAAATVSEAVGQAFAKAECTRGGSVSAQAIAAARATASAAAVAFANASAQVAVKGGRASSSDLTRSSVWSLYN